MSDVTVNVNVKGNIAKRKQYYTGDIPDGAVSMSKLAPDVTVIIEGNENDIDELREDITDIQSSKADKTELAAKADKEYNSGFIGGRNAKLRDVGGAAAGLNAQASSGSATGSGAQASEGMAAGSGAYTSHGGAGGKDAYSMHGGSLGRGAKTLHGAAVGDGAQTVDADGNPITGIQLGTGTNTEEGTAKFFDYTMMNADGTIPRERIPEGGVTTEKIASQAVTQSKIAANAINTLRLASGAVTKEKLRAELAAEIDGKAEQTALTAEAEARAAADAELENSKADKIALGSYYTKTEADDLLEDKVDMSSLSSYYTKTETDTKIAEAKSIIPKRYIVDTLPTEGIDTNGTYLVPAESPNENNLYDEYAYINGAWEIIGSAVEVDLSSYYTKTETDNKFCTRTAADNIVGNIETVKNNVDEALSRVNAAELRLDDIEQGDLPDLNNSINNLTSQVEGKADTSALGSYYTKDEIDYTVNTLQDGISEKIAKMQPINNPLAPSVNKTAQQVLTDSVYTNSQFSSVSQKATEALEGLEDKADIPAITTPTGTAAELTDNTEARFGEVATLTLSLPSDTSGDYISSVAFTSGTTATSLSYPDTITMIGTDCIDGVFAPVANKRYTLIVAYDGAGLVGYVAGHEVTA